jgi:hypothetical protein
MISISDDFVSETPKVRKNGNSFIVGLSKDNCKLLGITEKSKIQIYYRKIGDIE